MTSFCRVRRLLSFSFPSPLPVSILSLTTVFTFAPASFCLRPVIPLLGLLSRHSFAPRCEILFSFFYIHLSSKYTT